MNRFLMLAISMAVAGCSTPEPQKSEPAASQAVAAPVARP